MARLGGEIVSALRDGREVRVRSARTRDSRPLASLLDSVAAEPETTLLMLPGQFDARVWRRRIAAAVAGPGSILLVATVGADLAGNLGLWPEAHACSRHVAVLGMSVGREWRGQGVGSVLLTAACGWAAANGVAKLTLGVFPENLPAIRFYESHGFVAEGTRTAQYVRAGRYHDEMLMAHFLGGPS